MAVEQDFREPGWLERERRCLAQVRRGDRQAFGELYQVMAPLLYRQILLPRLGQAVAAQEVLADTFCTALTRLDQYEDRGTSIWFWLVRIAVNKVIDQHRARARGEQLSVGYERLLRPLDDEPGGPETELLREYEGRNLRQRVAQALARINPRYREVLELRILQELPRMECAARLQVKVATFDVLLLRALRSFKAEWTASRCATDLAAGHTEGGE